MTNLTLLFCYGSLRTGKYNHHLLRASTKVCDAFIEGFDLYSLGVFPAITPADSTHRVYGEVFEVNPAEFSVIAKMELGAGYTSQTAIPQATKEPHEDLAPCLVYVIEDSEWLKDVGSLVPSGNWIKRGGR